MTFILSEKDLMEWKQGFERADANDMHERNRIALLAHEETAPSIPTEHVTLPLLVSPDVWNKYLRELGHDGTIDAFLSGEMQEYQANEEYIESMSRMMQAEKEV